MVIEYFFPKFITLGQGPETFHPSLFLLPEEKEK